MSGDLFFIFLSNASDRAIDSWAVLAGEAHQRGRCLFYSITVGLNDFSTPPAPNYKLF